MSKTAKDYAEHGRDLYGTLRVFYARCVSRLKFFSVMNDVQNEIVLNLNFSGLLRKRNAAFTASVGKGSFVVKYPKMIKITSDNKKTTVYNKTGADECFGFRNK